MRARLLSALFAIAVSTACGGGGGDGGTTPPVPLQVPAEVSLSISSPDIMTSFGDARTVTAIVKDSAHAVIAAPSVTWTTNAPSVAILSPATGLSTTVTGVGDGTATITAKSGTASATISASVAQRLSAVALSPSVFALTVGSNRALVASATDARGNPIVGVSGFSFSSNNPGVASVASNGTVSAGSVGTAIISASLTRDAVTATGNATVNVSTVSTFPTTASVTTGNSSFSPPSVDIAVGGTVTWTFASTAHNVNFSSAGAPDPIPTTSSASVSRTFNTAGSFPYHCTLHDGMTATVVVH